ncbi:Tetraspanning orphan receptor isoform 1 [Schistosoma japonicum]|uniref:Tetraspanning orphan receptor n=2 Tax=Schistosoma japonicum TaxID=6182 RepID=TOR_SCHJA|nr:RecName: Full=Tetraspanning orphan receptor; AltName: Full=Complement C2 receptor inhibitor tetraspanning; AltName: Full=Complement C2 receptor inhibitor trispanning; AltName: Full=Trispanning orphan receptor [Schistosoma japonicum]AAW26644.1 SJCHGC06249 protein [Schistosoma japonicum]KAH8871944.1 Tetraspanning orphan receptor [Schistosoma japonicum]TNN17556.1 Tetraspanning orphan receptor isoform 1 [Schistosoma japonicum]CAX69316.1 complement inhibitory receptor [Schistosoma japonicum]
MPRASALLTSDPRHQFTCCLCLHVRTGTIIFGITQIIIQLIFISFLFLMTFNPRLFPEDNHGSLDSSQANARYYVLSALFRLVPAVSDIHESLTFPSFPEVRNVNDNKLLFGHNSESEVNFNFDISSGYKDSVPIDMSHSPSRLMSETHKRERGSREIKIRQFSPYIAVCVTTFSLAFCCFMVHGAITRQPTHLLPFFFIQVFDLIICLIHILGFMSSTSDIRLMIHTKTGPIYIKSTGLAFIILSISCMMLAFKAYCLGMVWDCYKYLMLNRRNNVLNEWYSDQWGHFSTFWSLLRAGRNRGNNLTGNLDSANESNTRAHPDPVTYDPSNDLPKYDDILKIPANAYAPPPYYCSNINGNGNLTQANAVTANTTSTNVSTFTTTTTTANTTTNVTSANKNDAEVTSTPSNVHPC